MSDRNRREFILQGVAWGISLTGLTGCATGGSRRQSSVEPNRGLTTTKPQKETLPDAKDIDWDLLITNGNVIDGTGKGGFRGTVAVTKDRIASVLEGSANIDHSIVYVGTERYRLKPDCKVILADGACVTPGFIDVHTHNEEYLRTNPRAEIRLLQGVTSQIGGNCGESVDDIPRFYQLLGDLGINYGQLMGYRNLRRLAMGEEAEREATGREIDRMVDLLQQGLQAGSPGLSFGLEYAPQSSATGRELKKLAQTLANQKGIMATHIRSESDQLLESIDEMTEIALESGVSWQYSHVKALFQDNWDKYPAVLERISNANAKGVDLWGDMYLYDFSSWDFGTGRISISEENIQLGLAHPRIFIASDSGLYANGKVTHPRAYGNFPRMLARYVRDRQVISLEEAVAKMSNLPAQRFRISRRGKIAPGYKADLLVFRLEDVQDRAKRNKPNLLPVGMRYVFVNGQAAVMEGEPTGCRAGQPLQFNS
ncbi:amidohydrolase family protein [Heliobacterium chlorum]|uniref:Amidohydrolase family protein n=1 Tax=Heliobacterium chlorum TaxID=2698 RepID=A0ABR7T0T6_HELCL|nr:amidohydrolase family protein [Heliobacterium chlorum]MBC9783727.1 amidohydrolase family protein [Heliobacterium chlorum]